MIDKLYLKLKEQLVELAHLNSALAVLHWDMEVNMPPKGASARATTIALLSGLIHEKFLKLNDGELLTKLKNSQWDEQQEAVVREVWRSFEREQKLPADFVREEAELTAQATPTWVQARAKSDFSLFLPTLKKIITLKQKEAELIGYSDSPYDALLDTFEPDMSTQEVGRILEDLKSFLIPFLARIQKSGQQADPKQILASYPIVKQAQFNEIIAHKFGFDLEAGRIDISTHPFAEGFHPNDVRITTRYDEHDIFQSLSSVMHEVGHALYEQGLPEEHFGTPLGQYISLGIHESQSRTWENFVGKSRAFWDYFYPQLQQVFPKPFKTLSLDDFYRAINHVTPSFIRTESDEVTYNLHIILRFKIERAIIEGDLAPEDIPDVWNKKMKEYFNLDVPDDAHGCLQDIHWSHGAFGYFPTYALGNLYAAQFFARAQHDLPNLEDDFRQGKFNNLREWQRQKIHIHGRFYTASQLVQEVTGKPLSSEPFINYLKNKFGQLYGV